MGQLGETQQALGVTQIYFSCIYDAVEYQSVYTKGQKESARLGKYEMI